MRRFRVRGILRAREGRARASVPSDGLCADRAASLQGCAALAAGRHQPDRELRAALARRLFQRRTWAVSLWHGLAGPRRRESLCRGDRARRRAGRGENRTDGAPPAGDPRHRRIDHLPDRPLWRRALHL